MSFDGPAVASSQYPDPCLAALYDRATTDSLIQKLFKEALSICGKQLQKRRNILFLEDAAGVALLDLTTKARGIMDR